MLQSVLSPFNLIAVLLVVILILYWINTFFILYHLIRFGIGTRPKQVALGFFAGSLGLFILLIVVAVGIIIFQP